MLQTWRLNSKGQNATHQRQAFDPETARPIVQQACNSCRVKKLRCSGEKTGCCRCQTLLQECVYAQNSTRGSARTRKRSTSTSKYSDETRRSSTSTNPPPAPPVSTPPTTEVKLESPCPEPFAPVSNALKSELHLAPAWSGSDSGILALLDVHTMAYEAPEYLPMQNIAAMQMSDFETNQCDDRWLFSWPGFTQENQLLPGKAPWEGAAVPLSLPSPGGRELGIQGYEEIPQTPTTISLGSEPIITNTQTTPLSMPPPTVIDQQSPDDCHWLPSQAQGSCLCLQMVVSLLEELDSEAVDTNMKELGSWLPRHKKALRCSEALLTCPYCQAKPEHMTILAFLTDRLIAMCDEVVSGYLLTLAENINHNILSLQDGAWLVWVGNFEIDSLQEWSALVSTMLVMQLRGLDTLMVKFRDMLGPIGGEGVRKKADSTQSRILALLEKLDPPQPD
ncbi:hypothetical protein GGS24DRAFT_446472 [Hypoxylon argillaceum]|nr:hypothetical protein GGS24DRAFT_446472 [Hypoxylon argillaceum]